MAHRESLGIEAIDHLTFYVEYLHRSREFYLEKMGFSEVAHTTPETHKRLGFEAAVFGAGQVRVQVCTPLNSHSPIAHYLKRHPAGVAEVAFRVSDLERTVRLLEKRGATLIEDPVRVKDGGEYREAAIATPLGDVHYVFVQRDGYPGYAPGFVSIGSTAAATGAESIPSHFGWQRIDHVTSNVRTMLPVALFYEHVLGFERFWKVEFHTSDIAPAGYLGSGLRSVVMRDPDSDIKFATNEPARPNFRGSQVQKFIDANHGPGVQHAAFMVEDIIPVVRGLREHQIEFLDTPDAYYEALPARLAKEGVAIEESIEELRRLGLLVDGEEGKYLLQLFLREADLLYHDERAGPFFYEIIQRKGSPGFGEGNFRALFESIERDQMGFSAKPQ
jgi:4-hydroxyphenylpyruvate dioxygenase